MCLNRIRAHLQKVYSAINLYVRCFDKSMQYYLSLTTALLCHRARLADLSLIIMLQVVAVVVLVHKKEEKKNDDALYSSLTVAISLLLVSRSLLFSIPQQKCLPWR